MSTLNKVIITKSGPNQYTFECPGPGPGKGDGHGQGQGVKTKAFSGTFAQLTHLLSKMKAGDFNTSPRSKRNIPLHKMMNPLKRGSPLPVWVFNHVFNQQFEMLSQESANLSEDKIVFEDEDMSWYMDLQKEEEEEEKGISFEEARGTIEKFAKETGKSTKEVEKLWKQAIEISEEFFGIKESKFRTKQWAYTVGVLKNMLGIKEQYLSIQLPNNELLEFETTNSDMSSDEWYTVLEGRLLDLFKEDLDPTEEPTIVDDPEEIGETTIELDKKFKSISAKDWIASGFSVEDYLESLLNEEPMVSTSFSVGDKNPISMKNKKKKVIDPSEDKTNEEPEEDLGV